MDAQLAEHVTQEKGGSGEGEKREEHTSIAFRGIPRAGAMGSFAACRTFRLRYFSQEQRIMLSWFNIHINPIVVEELFLKGLKARKVLMAIDMSASVKL